MSVVGYLINSKDGLSGERGSFYNYILGSGGLYVRTRSPLLEATICITPAEVRGLAPVAEEVRLIHGRIPRGIYNSALVVLYGDPHKERYLAVTWTGAYHIAYPSQKGDGGSVEYERVPNTVLDIHSHGSMAAFFSGTDDRDEQGMRLSMVLGKIDTNEPEYLMRVGIYGYFADVSFEEVFQECTTLATLLTDSAAG